MMEANDLLTRIENLYTLVRLHKWCKQLTHGISDIVPILLKVIHRATLSKIRKKLKNDTTTKEEIILSLVLLGKTGTPISQITDITYSMLTNRLGFQDINFLLHVLFNDIYPLPPDLTYDITNRVFLSFRRAIKSTLEIDSIISYHNPEAVVLYLTLLLCRVDLNKENKAMIYFLLSRIDVDLPPVLSEGVTEYIRNIKSIIEKVERSADEPLKNEHFRDSEILPLASAAGQVSAGADQKAQIDGNKKILPTHPRQDKIKPLIKQISRKLPKRLQREEQPAAGSEGRKLHQGVVTGTTAITPAGESESKPFLNRSFLYSGKYIKAVLQKITSQLKYSADRLIFKKEGKSKPYRQEPADQAGSIQKSDISVTPQFKINFSRNTEELLSILLGLYKKKTVSPLRHKRLLPFKIALGICVFLVPLWIIFFSRSRPDSSPPANSMPAAGEKQYMDMRESEPFERISFSLDGQFFFNRSASALHWIVTEKTSFWKLYKSLSESPDLPYAELEHLANLTWKLFMDKLTELNPGRDLYAIIYPGETFLLWSP